MTLWNYSLYFLFLLLLLLGINKCLSIYRSWVARTRQKNVVEDWTWDKLDQAIKDTFLAWTSDLPLDLYNDEDEYSREMKRRISLKKSLRTCCSGDVTDKEYIKECIVGMLLNQFRISKENVNQLIHFDNPERLSAMDKFDLLLYAYKKRYAFHALHKLIAAHKWDERKREVMEQGVQQLIHIVTVEDINVAYRQERLQSIWDDRICIIAQRLYQRYKGFSVIDEIRDMYIDGVSGGVSGIPGETMAQRDHWAKQNVRYSIGLQSGTDHNIPLRACDSIWIFYKGKTIRFAFLSFKTEAELRRVCHNIYKYQSPGSLTEADGYRINHMKDGSRVVVLRPPFAESWAFFVRKFDAQVITLKQLLTSKNAVLPISMLRFLMKGARFTAITGAQGTGKTTLLMALIESIYACYPLRVQEQTFELNLRKLYPGRNILTLRETGRIAGQSGLDVQKKTDGTVHILGEVATDPVAAWMVQMAQVASLFTIFTHHAKTFPDLVFSLRNSLLKTGMFHNEKIAEHQVSQVIHFNVHLHRDRDGNRYIERITECIPLECEEETAVLSSNLSSSLQMAWDTYVESAQRMHRHMMRTRSFTYRNIIEYRHGSYYLVNPISKQQQEAMEQEMTAEDKQYFRKWLLEEEGLSVAS